MVAAVRAQTKVVDVDRGYKRLRAWFRREGRRRGSHVIVGLRSDGPGGTEHSGGEGLTIAEIGSVHEFGLGVPERSFIRATFDERAEAYIRFIERLTGQALDRRGGVRGVLSKLGERAVADIIRRINAGIPPPLAQATIDRKDSAKQLVDTGQLKQSIDFQVVL